ncbi:MAG: hypothetical protein WBG08_08705 [Litorimonas sp.]
MTKTKFAAVLAVAAFVAAPAFAQDAEPDVKADAETLAQAELINTRSAEGVVTDEASCEYEGGSVVSMTEGRACFIPIRGEEASAKIYDGEKLGVIRCSGNGPFANEPSATTPGFCNVFLQEKVVPKTREELEAELAAQTQRELEANN